MENITIYREKDADLSILENKTVAFIGYGNQGRSQALNMRDHEIHVIIGNIPDDYRKRAANDGFETYDIGEAARRAEVIFLLIPDEIMCDIYHQEIAPNLKPHDSVVFAHGYNIAFNLIQPPADVDVLIVAPRMIGIGVRECFLNKEGYFSFIGIGQDASGQAHAKLLALAEGVGGLTKGGIKTSFKEETVLDLFTEQGFGPASSQMMMKPVDILLDAGYPAEAILVELIFSGKMKYAFDNMINFGVVDQIYMMSERSQYGILSRGLRFKTIIKEIVEIQKSILQHIESGAFAEEWEKKITKVKFKIIKFFASRVGFGRLEKKVRKEFQMPEVDLWAPTPYPTMKEIQKSKEIDAQLKDFLKYPEF